jgi:hypothetical protein
MATAPHPVAAVIDQMQAVAGGAPQASLLHAGGEAARSAVGVVPLTRSLLMNVREGHHTESIVCDSDFQFPIILSSWTASVRDRRY